MNQPIKKVNCIQIDTNGLMTQVKICFDPNINQKLIPMSAPHSDIIILIDNMKTYHCHYYQANVAKGLFPENSYCYAFYQADKHSSSTSLNKVASHIVNNIYNSDTNNNKSQTNLQCYGVCYIVLIDNFFEPHDLSNDAFIHIYNKVHTVNGVEEREYFNRLFYEPKLSACCLFADLNELKKRLQSKQIIQKMESKKITQPQSNKVIYDEKKDLKEKCILM